MVQGIKRTGKMLEIGVEPIEDTSGDRPADELEALRRKYAELVEACADYHQYPIDTSARKRAYPVIVKHMMGEA